MSNNSTKTFEYLQRFLRHVNRLLLTFINKNINISLNSIYLHCDEGDFLIKTCNKTVSVLLFFFFCFSAGIIQAQEKIWDEPLDKADLLLFSSHSDDEHLFFAGILPYCAANGIKAQVVYMTNHNDNPQRNTELLNGLWAVGINNYPVISRFPDLFSESLEEAIRGFRNRGFSEDDFIEFCAVNIRRFKPQVVIGHDIAGEYGHGAHMLSAFALMRAVELAADPDYHSESFALYGVWDTPKMYLNQWNERRIHLSSINEPLPFFDGKTAFQMSQYGFTYHQSQHWTWFYRWIYGTADAPVTRSTQIRLHEPGRFGLYRTLVGDDSHDASHFFENITLIKDIIEFLDEETEEQAIEIYYSEPYIFLEPETADTKKGFLLFIIPAFIIIIAAALFLIFFRKKSKRVIK